jgi:CDP-paratose synthetase
MKVLITGATGYVGRSLLDVIDINSYNTFAVVRHKQNDFPEGIKQIIIDDTFEDVIQDTNPDVVIHLATYFTYEAEKEHIDKLIESNLSFGSRLLNALKKTDLKYFINTGSFNEYHYNDGKLNPTNYYAATKTAYRSILKYFSEVSGFKVFNVIPFSIYGGRQQKRKIIDILFESLVSYVPLKLSDGNQYLDFIHLNDVLFFYTMLLNNLEKVGNDEVFFLGTGKPYTIRELANIVTSVTNRQANIQWGAHPPRERDTIYAAASISKMKQLFNWQPSITLEQGVKLKSNEFFNL